MLRVLLLSDLHAIDGDPTAPASASNLSALPSFDTETLNPLRAIPKMLKRDSLTVDWILCPGDISDRANPIAQRFAWESLERLRVDIGAECLIGTVGNHDVDSRLQHDEFDPKGNLQSLSPPFPGLDEVNVDRFWSRNFAVVQKDDIRLVILNSAAFHGIHSDHPNSAKSSEYLYGRVSDRTIDAIEAAVSASDAKLNILLTHHHIMSNEDVYRSSNLDVMKGGQILLKRLSDKTSRRWVVIHGHQHFPSIKYAGTGSPLPIIFSAGSVSARLSPQLLSRASNQFYYLEFPIHRYEELGWEGCATVRSWHWISGTGWLPTPFSFGAGIPSGSGFGCIISPSEIAKQISGAFTTTGKQTIKNTEMCRLVPALEFMLSEDLKAAFKICKRDHQISHHIDTEDGPGPRLFIKEISDGV